MLFGEAFSSLAVNGGQIGAVAYVHGNKVWFGTYNHRYCGEDMLRVLATIFVLAHIAVAPAQSQPTPRADEYAIYTVVLNEMFVHDDSYVLINDRTSTKAILPIKQTLRSGARQMRAGLSIQLQNDFATNNQARYRIEKRFDLPVKTILLDQAEIDRLIGNGEWIEFLKTYPGHGVIEFSRVGFNLRKDQALVYAASQGGPKSGSGFLILLSKRNNGWVIDQKVFVWLS